MGNSTWIETKRDADLDESGNAVVKKVQLEPAGFTGKNRVDLILRIIGLAAIITPIMLVYLQQRASLNTEKAIQQLEVYSQTAIQLSSICRRELTSKEFAKSKEELAYNLPPRIAFLFSDEISNHIEEINQIIPVYESIGHNTHLLDSLFIHINVSTSSVGSYRNEIVVEFTDSLENAAHIKTADSSRGELIHWYRILQNNANNSQSTDTTIRALVQQMVDLDTELLQFSTSIISNLNAAYNILIDGQSPATAANSPTFVSLRQRHQQYLARQPELEKKYKSILEKMRKALELKIKNTQVEMRNANNAFR